MNLKVVRCGGSTGAEELANYEARFGPVSRSGYEYWRMRGEYSGLSDAGLDAWQDRERAKWRALVKPE